MDLNRMTAERAYELWVQRGRPHGSHKEDWYEAERQLTTEQHVVRDTPTMEHRDASLAATFPASDPPASHLPDVPPSNAEDKWAAARSRKQPSPGESKTRPSEPDGNPPKHLRHTVDRTVPSSKGNA